MRRAMIGLACFAAALLAATAAQRPGHRQDRRGHVLFGPVRRHRRPDRQRHQALHEAARRHRRRQEDRDHPQGHRRHRARRRQAPGAGADRARQGRHPRRLRPHAERAGRRRRLGAGQEVHGQHERRDLDHHHQVALHGAHLVHRAAGQRGARHLGLQERRAQGLHAGLRLRPGPRRRSRVPEGVQGGRRRDHRLGALSGREPGLHRLPAARQGRQPGRHLHLGAGRHAAGGDRQGDRRARHRQEQDQGASARAN